MRELVVIGVLVLLLYEGNAFHGSFARSMSAVRYKAAGIAYSTANKHIAKGDGFLLITATHNLTLLQFNTLFSQQQRPSHPVLIRLQACWLDSLMVWRSC